VTIRIDALDRIHVITIERPETMNALDPKSMRSFAEALVAFRDNPDVDVAVITGAGDRAFCAGADLKQTAPDTTPFVSAYLAPWDTAIDTGAYVRAITLRELRIDKPMLAAINGHAIGGGLEIALECHLRVATPNATFGLPEARWASVPGAGGVSNLLRNLPRAIAMKMLLTGERIDAETALRHGLVSELVEPDQLLPRAIDIAHTVAANGPLALRAIVAMASKTFDMSLTQSIETEHLYWGLLRDTADRVEGRAAFAATRNPNYQGR
jgi:E-phenylitaconyl-CoA hydratase